MHSRNAEGRYWQNFSTHVHQAFPLPAFDTNVQAACTSWHISSAEALTAVEHQRAFFKSVDSFVYDPPGITATARSKPDKFDSALRTAVQKLPTTYTRSDT
eukprot:2918281-Karenia_brevis.AAC.1